MSPCGWEHLCPLSPLHVTCCLLLWGTTWSELYKSSCYLVLCCHFLSQGFHTQPVLCLLFSLSVSLAIDLMLTLIIYMGHSTGYLHKGLSWFLCNFSLLPYTMKCLTVFACLLKQYARQQYPRPEYLKIPLKINFSKIPFLNGGSGFEQPHPPSYRNRKNGQRLANGACVLWFILHVYPWGSTCLWAISINPAVSLKDGCSFL